MNAYARYDDCQTKYCQIVYLAKKREESFEFISELTGYAVSTVRSYVYKFSHLLEKACEMFKYSRKKKKDEIKINEPVPQNKVTKSEAVSVNKTIHPNIEFICPDVSKDSDKFYLIRAFKADGTRVFSKVGTTIREILIRMKEHLRAYANLGVVRIVVDKIWDCGNIPSEGVESWFRALYIRKWPEKFNKNDRFFDVDFDLEEAENLFKQYINLSV